MRKKLVLADRLKSTTVQEVIWIELYPSEVYKESSQQKPSQ